MRTIPEIVAEMKELIAELESHTGKPALTPKTSFQNYGYNGTMAGDFPPNPLETINLGAQPLYTFNGVDEIRLSSVDDLSFKSHK